MADSQTIGDVNSRRALKGVVTVRPGMSGADEVRSPLGRNNWPNYLTPTGGLGTTPPSLSTECSLYDVRVVDSSLPDTKDGKSGKELVAAKDFKKGDIICYYWGEFLTKTCSRYRKLKHAGCPYFMKLSNIPVMKDFVLLGHHSCAAVYIQSADYNGPGQEDIEANVEFLEQPIMRLCSLEPQKYVYISATRHISKGDTFFASYAPSSAMRTHRKKRPEGAMERGSKGSSSDEESGPAKKKHKKADEQINPPIQDQSEKEAPSKNNKRKKINLWTAPDEFSKQVKDTVATSVRRVTRAAMNANKAGKKVTCHHMFICKVYL